MERGNILPASLLIFLASPKFFTKKKGKAYKKCDELNQDKNEGRICRMKLIQLKGAKKDKVNGCYTLITNGTVRCFKGDKYEVPEYCLKLLRDKGINFRAVKTV